MSLTDEGSVLNFYLTGITANASTSYLRVTKLWLQRPCESHLCFYLFIYLFYLLTYLFIYLFICLPFTYICLKHLYEMKRKVHIHSYMIYLSFPQDKIIKVNYCIEQGEYHILKKN